MNSPSKRLMTRRTILKSSAALAGTTLGPLATAAETSAAPPVNKLSSPSDLKITDIRACTVAANYDYPIIQDGTIRVPETPGLGVELNPEVVKEHLRYPGYLEPTPMFDDFIISDYRRVGPWPHYDEDGHYVNAITY
jgi:hypothetical protein